VEITSNAQAARLLSWALRKHTFISYALYTAGATVSADFLAFIVCTSASAAAADADGPSSAEISSMPRQAVSTCDMEVEYNTCDRDHLRGRAGLRPSGMVLTMLSELMRQVSIHPVSITLCGREPVWLCCACLGVWIARTSSILALTNPLAVRRLPPSLIDKKR